MEKLKKLKFWKKRKREPKKRKSLYRYRVKISKDDFLDLEKVEAYDIENQDETVIFYTTQKGYKQLNANHGETKTWEIKDRVKEKIHKIVKEQTILMISLVLIFLMMILSNCFVREISFENPKYYDYDVYQSVNRHLKKYGPFYLLDTDLNSLGRELRTTYPKYAYIGILRKGSNLIVEISKQELPNSIEQDNSTPGNLYAKYDGYIVGLEVQKGVVVVGTSQSVKKGDLLVTGNLDYYNQPNLIENMIHPKGIVLADVAVYEKIKVPKNTTFYGYSGNLNSSYFLRFFGLNWSIGTTNQFEMGHKTYNGIFELGEKIGLFQVTEYEKEKMIIHYNQEEAIRYANSKILDTFMMEQVSEKEKYNPYLLSIA